MKPIFLIPLILMILSAAADAQEIFKCFDDKGVAVFTSTPQRGMKCATKESDDESRRSHDDSSTNLIDKCNQWSRESDEIDREIIALEKNRLELQKEQLENSKNESSSRYSGYWTRNNPMNDRMYKINKEISTLSQKRSLIQQGLRLHKCDTLNQDLSRLNQRESSSKDKPPRRRGYH